MKPSNVFNLHGQLATFFWIPVQIRIPQSDDWCLVTILDQRGDSPFRYTDFGWYFDRAGCWIVDSEERNDIIAWSPLPSPYNEREGDAE